MITICSFTRGKLKTNFCVTIYFTKLKIQGFTVYIPAIHWWKFAFHISSLHNVICTQCSDIEIPQLYSQEIIKITVHISFNNLFVSGVFYVVQLRNASRDPIIEINDRWILMAMKSW